MELPDSIEFKSYQGTAIFEEDNLKFITHNLQEKEKTQKVRLYLKKNSKAGESKEDKLIELVDDETTLFYYGSIISTLLIFDNSIDFQYNNYF